MYQKSVELYQELRDSQAAAVQQWLTELQTHSSLYKELTLRNGTTTETKFLEET